MRRKILLTFLTCTALLSTLGCSLSNKSFSSAESINSSVESNIDSKSESSSDNKKEIEAHLVELANGITAKLPSEISEDYLLPTINEEGYELSYEVNQSTIENGVLKYINGREDITINLTIIVSYEELSYKAQANIIFKGVEMINEGLKNYLQAYKEKLPSLIKQDYIAPLIPHNNYSCSLKVDGHAITHNIVKYIFPIERKEGTFEITVKDLQTGDELSETQSFIYEKEAVATLTPKLYIDTSNVAITSKDNYVNGFVTLEEADEKGIYQTTLNRAGMKIRGRGNSTWSLPKKPYKIKFNSKTSLFGQKAQKDWVLLANYVDQTLVRDYLAKALGSTLDSFAFTPSCHYVDVYLNNDYQGSYTVTDQVEVKSGRVDVERDSSNEDTGYLVELDQRLIEYGASGKNETWFEINARDGGNSRNIPFDIKYPEVDEEFFRHEQLLYIQNYMQTALTAIANHGKWQNYIDINTAVDFFLVEDLFKNVDVGYASAFMYKDKGGKLFLGPLWDFDLSCLNQGHLEYNLRQHYDWYASRWDKNPFCYFLMKDNDFKKALKERWNEWSPNLLNDINSLIDNMTRLIKTSRIRNFEKWDIIGKDRNWYTSTEVYNAKTYDAQVALIKGWFNNRIGWMNEEIAKF